MKGKDPGFIFRFFGAIHAPDHWRVETNMFAGEEIPDGTISPWKLCTMQI